LERRLQAAGHGDLDHPLPPEGGVPGSGFKARNKFPRILTPFPVFFFFLAREAM
jgi:hypothetical protein